MTAQHTPGPWVFSKGKVDYCEQPVWEILAGDTSLMDDKQYYPFTPENEADWHLISAAPELLEALIVARMSSGWYQMGEPLKKMIDDAIAKATGEPK